MITLSAYWRLLSIRDKYRESSGSHLASWAEAHTNSQAQLALETVYFQGVGSGLNVDAGVAGVALATRLSFGLPD